MPLVALVAGLSILLGACAGSDDPVEPVGSDAVDTEVDDERSDPTDEVSTTPTSEDGGSVVVVDGDDAVETAEDGADETPADPQAAVAAEIDQLEGDELEEFVARRYEAFWLAFGEARGQPDADPATAFPRLADLAAGQQLDAAYAELIDMAETGRALRAAEEPALPGLDNEQAHRVRIERIDDASAELVTCFVNDRQSVQVSDGAVISDLVVTVKAESTMVRTDGTWKLVRSQAVALDPGVAGCWLEDEALYPW